MSFQIKKTTTGAEPITVSEMKIYLKVDYTTDDTYIGELITAARTIAEDYCNRSFSVQTIEYLEVDPVFPISLPFPNHNAITEVKIDDVVTTDYTTTGLTQLNISLSALQGSALDGEFYVKYTTTGDITKAEKQTIMKIAAEMYENRNTDFTDNGMSWLLPFRNYT